MTETEEHHITRKGMLAAVAGGAGALLLLASGKQASAQGIVDARLINTNNTWINPATEDTLALIKTNTDLLSTGVTLGPSTNRIGKVILRNTADSL